MSTLLEIHIGEIKKKLADLHRLAASSLTDAMEAFAKLDEKMGSEVKAKSSRVEDLSDNIEANVFETIARRQPVASDLRKLATYLLVSHSLYRVGRYAYKIAHIVTLCDGKEHFKDLESLPYLAEIAVKTLDIAMKGVLEEDLSGIDQLEKLEADSDRETSEMFQEIVDYLRKQRDITTMAMYYVIVGRYFERAADHAFTIAERAWFMVTGNRKKLGLAFKGRSPQAPH
ncbi:MAG: phosphate transport system regulatory protein PhoU [Candidatus Thorarchaeota archaeon]|nr:MAG: phosphate transport system regulatory protein PhoU [Candidatus Thorarchaeota archaeon]RLI57199.1 MAG: phosphate transport system regulatory protein PhoU [Candidatus Thorarchaeota archaeon]